MPPVDKIKKAITWIRKSLEITEKTTQPGTISGEIIPLIDVLGWDRYQEQTVLSNTVTASDSVTSPAVPADIMRLVTAASLETDDALVAYTLWLELTNSLSGQRCGIGPPITLPISAIPIRVSLLNRRFLLSPGDTIVGRSTPAGGVGIVLRLRWTFVDFPLGEYVKSL